SRRWLASCGLTVEQMQNQMDPVYTPARKIHLYHCDHRGLPLALISTEGATAWCAEYDEWGNLLNEENPHQLQQLIRLPGQQYDEESGLYYNRHRYYDPLQGRYITQDPIGLKGGWNLYGYQLNPISDIDPLGLSMWEDAKSGACTNGLCGTLSAMIGPDKFDSIDSTAYDALNKINSQSICEDKEFAGLICKDNSGRYFSTAPNRGERKGSYPFNSPCPNGTEKVSAYHTHGADSHGEYWDEIFSGKDEKIVKNKAIALELAEIYVKNRYGQDAAEEEKPYEITELTTSWVVEGTIHSDQIAGGVFIIEIGKNDGRILNFGHGK
ncbi:NTF2 fold immunity protein, partial [Escherichia coli]